VDAGRLKLFENINFRLGLGKIFAHHDDTLARGRHRGMPVSQVPPVHGF
jgi:hypothetical protein